VITNKRENRASDALTFAILGVLLWPFGLLLGPVAVVRGISARHRIEASGGELIGANVALAAIVLGVAGSCLAYAALAAEVASLILTGGLIPAY
jgi:uncharacterized Tic20 family protein